jgi:hypothetical protein
MKKNSVLSMRKIGLWMAAITTCSVALIVSLQGGAGLSKFNSSGATTPENASIHWQSSGELNPYRWKLSKAYVTQLDALTVAVLRKWKNLSYEAFVAYLKNLSAGIVTLGKQPAYASNADIQNIIGYLVYEIDDTTRELENTHFMSKIAQVITGTGVSNTGVISPVNSKGSLQGVMYLQANYEGTLTRDAQPVRSEKLDTARKPFEGMDCPYGSERIGLGMRMEEGGAKNYVTYTCVKTVSQADFDAAPKGSLMGIIYIPSDSKGNLINGTNALTNTKLDAVSSPFSGVSCPTGSERVGLGLRKEENGARNYQVFTCVKTTGSTDTVTIEDGTMMGVVYIPANDKGVHTNGVTPLNNAKLDAVRYPFTGIECPTGFQRMGVGLRMETNATQNYQVFTCVKSSQSTLGPIPVTQDTAPVVIAPSEHASMTVSGNTSWVPVASETIFIPASEIKSENMKLNFPNGMNISIPSGLSPEERQYHINQYNNMNTHFN